jgi:hypothetical protein
MRTRYGQPFVTLVFLTLLSLILSSCAPGSNVPPTATPRPTARPTSIPLPAIAWTPGESYFNISGRPAFLFSRNPAGLVQKDWATLAGMAHQQGDQFVRVFTLNASMGGDHGYGYSPQGKILEGWSYNWENFFDVAEADGLYVIPSFWGWLNWNDTGFNDWAVNPFNSANGGPADDPREIYKKDSPTQLLYLAWFKSLVTRWQSHRNILAWEVATEVNLVNGISQTEGIYLAEQLARVVHEADTLDRPVTSSVADWSGWSEFLRSDAVDYINFHPYPPDGTLDRRILEQVPLLLNTYHKPVLIGESGLNAIAPDTGEGKITLSPNARIGFQHAIWAELVSGAMNGRALWWEDGYGLYIQGLGMPYIQKYTDLEAPVLRFAEGLDMTGFKPVPARTSSKLFGAALGNETNIIGWYRDASCEPPDWNLQAVISGQSVKVPVPGSAESWKIDFYSTKDGKTILSSVSLPSKGSTVVIPLPDFQNDIVFKMRSEAFTDEPSESSIIAPSESVLATTTDAIAGTWNGTISNTAGTFSTSIKLTIPAGCKPGKACGTFSTPQIPCSGDLILQTIDGESYLFQEQNSTGSDFCQSGGYEQLQLLANGSLSYAYMTTPGSEPSSTGILRKP